MQSHYYMSGFIRLTVVLQATCGVAVGHVCSQRSSVCRSQRVLYKTKPHFVDEVILCIVSVRVSAIPVGSMVEEF